MSSFHTDPTDPTDPTVVDCELTPSERQILDDLKKEFGIYDDEVALRKALEQLKDGIDNRDILEELYTIIRRWLDD